MAARITGPSFSLISALPSSLYNSESHDRHMTPHDHTPLCSVVFRLYWYPVKVIYSCTYVGPIIILGGPWFLVFLPMLWGLFVMQVGGASSLNGRGLMS